MQHLKTKKDMAKPYGFTCRSEYVINNLGRVRYFGYFGYFQVYIVKQMFHWSRGVMFLLLAAIFFESLPILNGFFWKLGKTLCGYLSTSHCDKL